MTQPDELADLLVVAEPGADVVDAARESLRLPGVSDATRTARAGAKGRATTLMTADEVRLVVRFERELGIAMHHVRLREGRVIAAGAERVAAPRGPR